MLIIIMVEVWSTGGEDISWPIYEKHTLPINTPINVRINPLGVTEINRSARIIGIMLDIKAKTVDAKTSPRSIAHNGIGIDTSRSRVWARVSVGKITGPMAVAEKKTTIAVSPGNNTTGLISLPIINERKKKKGNSNPKMIVGPFK